MQEARTPHGVRASADVVQGGGSAPYAAQVQQRRDPAVGVGPPGAVLGGQQPLQLLVRGSFSPASVPSVKTRTPYQACSGAPIPDSVAVSPASRSARTSRPSRFV